jgi:hypothetical protein
MFGGKPLLGYAKEAIERKLSQHQADSGEWACAWRGFFPWTVHPIPAAISSNA